MAVQAKTQLPLARSPPLYSDTPLAILATPKFATGMTDSFTTEASHMTLSHNSIIRGFNSIYQQAPRLQESDAKDFVGYCLAWYYFVEEHHRYEETRFFLDIEEAVGEKAVMNGEVEQHVAFHDGLERFKIYLLQHEADFSHAALIAIMDSFSEPLYSHLQSEPQSLLALSRFSTPERPINLVDIALKAGKKSLTISFVFNILPVFLLNMDAADFEGGIWHNVFPPVPTTIRWILTVAVPMWQGRRWRFTSCNADGRIKHLAV
ncbi:hypothetical protein MMC18_008526 [Xylographa bjoerkii]|nr:hypothetical protein [Xylographa bjoerkii]